MSEDSLKNMENPNKSSPDVKVVDKRSSFFEDDSVQGEVNGSSSARLPSYVEKLQKELNENKEKMIELSQLMRRSQKDSEDFRVRLTKDVERRVLNGKISFLKDFLELFDNLERGLSAARKNKNFDSFFEGIEMVKKQFQQKLNNSGVKEIDSIEKDFNPEIHDAISMIEVDKKELDGKVVEEVQKGYIIEDQVLRPSKVIVGKFEEKN